MTPHAATLFAVATTVAFLCASILLGIHLWIAHLQWVASQAPPLPIPPPDLTRIKEEIASLQVQVDKLALQKLTGR